MAETWTRAKVIAMLRRFRAERRALTFERVPLYLLTAAAEHFGTYQAALAAADVSGRKAKSAAPTNVAGRPPRMVWTKAAVVAGIRKVVRDGNLISASPGMCAAAKRHFGSVAAAAKAANIPYWSRRSWTRDEVVAELRAIARREGQVTFTTLIELRMRSAIVKYFGGITKACEVAGVIGYDERLRRQHEAQDNAATVVRRLRAVAGDLDNPMREVDLPGSLARAARRRFGSIEAARAAAKLRHPPRRRKWKREAIPVSVKTVAAWVASC